MQELEQSSSLLSDFGKIIGSVVALAIIGFLAGGFAAVSVWSYYFVSGLLQ